MTRPTLREYPATRRYLIAALIWMAMERRKGRGRKRAVGQVLLRENLTLRFTENRKMELGGAE